MSGGNDAGRFRIAEVLLRGFIAEPGLEDAILGDLVEERNERAEEPGSGPAGGDRDRAWYWGQLVRSAPHLLRVWWRGLSPDRALRTVGRVTAFLAAAIALAAVAFAGIGIGSGGPPALSAAGDTQALAATLLLAGAAGAAAGGFLLAWATRRAPMCPVVLLGLAWIPIAPVLVSLRPVAHFPPPGPPAWLPVALPVLLIAVTVVVGGAVTALRGVLRRERRPLATDDPPTPEEPVEKTKTAVRLAVRPLLAAAALLAVPLAAMQFTDEMAWTPFDFAFAGGLVFGTGVAFEAALRTTASTAYRWAVGTALAAGFLLIWVTGAVGIIGSEAHPANLMYAGVLAVGISGAFVARFRPDGMARAMVAAAVVQALIAVIAIACGLGRPYSGAVELALLNGFWIALFTVSAALFRAAAREGSSAAAGEGG